MMGHRRAPAVEYGGDADAGAEMLWIGGDGEQCLGRCAEQQIVDDRLAIGAISAGTVKTKWK
jgi:hypothetical protein